jgi:DNA-binding NtrC family response regulator
MHGVPAPRFPILIVDDDESVLVGLTSALASSGFGNLVTTKDSREVMGILSTREIEAVLLDLTMPHLSGQELLPRIREEHPDIPVIVVTGVAELETAVDCMRMGAFDYLVKAVQKGKLLASVSRAIEIRELRRENRSLGEHLMRGTLEHPEFFSHIDSRDEKVMAAMMYVESIAASTQIVLITGETGAGKELFAHALHRASGRTGQLVSVNIAGLDETMFADTLFGHVKGAFTGAETPRKGLIESASGGSLFLDEIGDLSSASQVRLLRLLESHEYFPLGSDAPRRSDARIIVATNRDLVDDMGKGRFRRDLFYRLRTHHVHVPPLRERLNDIRPLADSFFREAAKDLGKDVPAVPPDLYDLLSTYDFPGNIREMRSMIFDAVSRHKDGELDLESFTLAIKDAGGRGSPDIAALAVSGKFPTLKEATEILIRLALDRCGGNQAKAAGLLGISPPALNRRLRGEKE